MGHSRLIRIGCCVSCLWICLGAGSIFAGKAVAIGNKSSQEQTPGRRRLADGERAFERQLKTRLSDGPVVVTGVDRVLGYWQARQLRRIGIPIVGISLGPPIGSKGTYVASRRTARWYAKPDTFVDQVADFAQSQGASAVLPSGEDAFLLAAHRGRLGTTLLATADVTAIVRCFHKETLPALADAAGISSPPALRLSANLGEALDQIGGFQFPAILKRVYGIGGVDMQRLARPSDLDQAALARSLKYGAMLLQPLISGHVYSVGGVAMSGKLMELGATHDLVQTVRGLATIRQAVPVDTFLPPMQKLVAELDFTGVFHAELIHDARDDQLKLIDLNPRLWRGATAHGLAGINLPSIILASHCGLWEDAPIRTVAPGHTSWSLISELYRIVSCVKARDLHGAADGLLKLAPHVHQARLDDVMTWDLYWNSVIPAAVKVLWRGPGHANASTQRQELLAKREQTLKRIEASATRATLR